MSLLRKQMQADMVLRGLAPRTQEAYLAAVAGLARHYGQSPDRLTEEQGQQGQRYLLHLIEERKLAWASTNQAACVLPQKRSWPHAAQRWQCRRRTRQSLKPCRHSCSGWRTSILAAALAAGQAGCKWWA